MDSPYRQLNWLYLIFINSWQLLDPIFLCPDWRFGTVPLITTLTDPRHILTVATLTCWAILVTFGLVTDTSRARKLLFGLSLCIFPFMPASNLFFPIGFVVAERVLYTPSTGYCFLVAYGLSLLLRSSENKKWKVVSIITCTSASLLLILSLVGFQAARTLVRNEDWTDKVTLYSSGVRCNSYNGVMLTNLGIEHGRLRNFTFAEKLYRRSMEVAPEHSRGFSNFGGLMEARRRYEEAEEVIKG